MEVERQVQDKKLEEERLKAEAKKQEEERIKAKEAQRKIQDMQDQCNLGEMYYDSEDYEKALYHYRQAADQGHADAQYHLGLMYYNGYGVQQNYDKAVKWYRKAAEQGDAAAQKNLQYIGKGLFRRIFNI